MQIRTSADVDKVLLLFRRHASGSATLGDAFTAVLLELNANAAEAARHRALDIAVGGVAGEHGTLLTILERSDWQKRAAQAGHLPHTSWWFFATLDVEHYYIALRSLFDHVARVCGAIATKPGQVPESFHDLLVWRAKAPQRAHDLLGSDADGLLAQCSWFDSVRDTRDGIVHYGALTLALPRCDALPFTVVAGARSTKVPPAVMRDERYADFELFMAWTLGNVGLLLDGLGSIILRRLPERRGLQAQVGRDAFGVLCGHLDRLATRLREDGQADSSAGV